MLPEPVDGQFPLNQPAARMKLARTLSWDSHGFSCTLIAGVFDAVPRLQPHIHRRSHGAPQELLQGPARGAHGGPRHADGRRRLHEQASGLHLLPLRPAVRQCQPQNPHPPVPGTVALASDYDVNPCRGFKFHSVDQELTILTLQLSSDTTI